MLYIYILYISYLFLHSAKLRVQGFEMVPVVSLPVHSCLNIFERYLTQPTTCVKMRHL